MGIGRLWMLLSKTSSPCFSSLCHLCLRGFALSDGEEGESDSEPGPMQCGVGHRRKRALEGRTVLPAVGFPGYLIDGQKSTT